MRPLNRLPGALSIKGMEHDQVDDTRDNFLISTIWNTEKFKF